MFVFCKACKKDRTALIDTGTLKNGKELTNDTKVICEECKGELTVTAFARKSLYSMKQYYIKKPKGAFEYDCKACNDFQKAVVKSDKAVCVKCGTDLKLAPIMISTLKAAAKSKNND